MNAGAPEAMTKHFLGEHFDIHGGGQDLLFPHHENKIAACVWFSSQESRCRVRSR